METKFAPAERASREKLFEEIRFFKSEHAVAKFLNSVITPVVIVNKQRQIVFANKSFLDLLNLAGIENAAGKRPGEILDCKRSFLEPGGCGASEFCEYCGAVHSILNGLKGQENTEECRIIQKDEAAMDLLVKSSPLVIDSQPYVIFAVNDISHEKRRRALEKIFFHDVLNTAGGINGFLSIINDVPEYEKAEFISIVSQLSGRLIEEIKYQSMLTAAENEDLALNETEIEVHSFLRKIAALYANHDVAKGKKIELDQHLSSTVILTDEVLLSRIVGNMAKNALEASDTGDTVTIGCIKDKENIEFWVHNPSFMPRDVQMQIFQRSFSTKGKGRGLGTYSMKLLGEKYLKGHVDFSTSEAGGTIFKIILSDKIKN